MTEGDVIGHVPELPKGGKDTAAARFALNAASGAIPFVGGLLSAGASAWSEREQARINDFLKHLADMLAAEMKEKTQTIMELTARIVARQRRGSRVTQKIPDQYPLLFTLGSRPIAKRFPQQRLVFLTPDPLRYFFILHIDVVKLFLPMDQGLLGTAFRDCGRDLQ
jgi:hypothetical protein